MAKPPSDPSSAPRLVELVRVRRGRPELLGEHVRRLARAMGEAAPPFWHDLARVEQLVRATLPTDRDRVFELEPKDDGVERREAEDGEPEGEKLAAGFDVAIGAEATSGAAPSVGRKTIEELRRARARLASVRARGLQELIRRAPSGVLLGGVASSLFLITDEGLVTPSLASGAFPGITRRATLRAARDLGVPAREAVVTEADLAKSSDAFLASSALGLVAIRTIDGRPLVAPARGTAQRALVPKLRLRLHELGGASFLPEDAP